MAHIDIIPCDTAPHCMAIGIHIAMQCDVNENMLKVFQMTNEN